jgi:hypothetical protein
MLRPWALHGRLPMLARSVPSLEQSWWHIQARPAEIINVTGSLSLVGLHGLHVC